MYERLDVFHTPTTMHDLPTDWSALCALVFLLGMRHGFDADHLATIDGFTRLGARHGAAHTRYCGALFSLGHGVVVMAIALIVGVASEHWTPPEWIDLFGAWVSIAFLLTLGIVNLRVVLAAPAGTVVGLVGLKGRLLGRLLGRLAPGQGPVAVAVVGALFALSFDTVSQSALFAVTAAQFGGVAHSLMLGGLFVLGMLATDALNGWWIARLIARADQIAALASRVMSVAVSAVSLLVAGLGIAKLSSPAIDAWSDGKELAFGAIVVTVIALSYLMAHLLARRVSQAVAVPLEAA